MKGNSMVHEVSRDTQDKPEEPWQKHPSQPATKVLRGLATVNALAKQEARNQEKGNCAKLADLQNSNTINRQQHLRRAMFQDDEGHRQKADIVDKRVVRSKPCRTGNCPYRFRGQLPETTRDRRVCGIAHFRRTPEDVKPARTRETQWSWKSAPH
jgi:hypothetical protein